MAEMLEESSEHGSTTVGIYRTSSTVKGGRRFSFSALVVVGDKRGRVGMGYCKANEVPKAIEKAQKEARRKMRHYTLQGRTLPHLVEGRFGACKVRIVPASPGTGVIAGAAIRAVLEMLGVQDCLSKAYGSSNPKNVVKATFHALSQLRNRERIEELRGMSLGKTTVEEAIEKGAAFMPATSNAPKAEAPVNKVGEQKRGGKGRGRPRGRGGRGRGEEGGEAAEGAPPAAPESSA
jgi:small subunit ribosomal protein S5